jgi:alcohol dehydrogenase (cytochrome c)
MKHTGGILAALVAAVALAAGLAGTAAAGTSTAKGAIPAFSAQQLTSLPGDNWITPGGDLGQQRHSTLSQINTGNVSQLVQAFHVNDVLPNVGDPAPEHGGEASHIEYNGVLYSEDMWGRVYANDATTGARLWAYEPYARQTYTGTENTPTYAGGQKGMPITSATAVASTRGVSIGDGKVFVQEATSASIVALDAATGKQLWAHVVANVNMGFTISVAPVYYDGMVLAGTSGGDRGAPCIAFALDAKTGKPLWHFNMIPVKKGQPGYDTWAHPLAFNGGGAIWASLSVDPTTGLAYANTGNPIPYTAIVRGPGKEYFTNGIVALHVKTGKLAWFFQAVHHDMWDADQSQPATLYDLTYKGKLRHAAVFANKDGLWYVLDRETGKPIIPVKETPVQQSKEVFTYPTEPIPATTPLNPQTVPDPAAWKGLTGPDGQPLNIGSGPAGSFVAIDTKHYSVTAAFGNGASSQRPASVDTKLGLYFNESSPGFLALESETVSEIGTLLEGQNFFNMKVGPLTGTPAAAIGSSRLEAMDLRTGKMVWKVDHMNSDQVRGQPSIAFSAGTMTTDGGLLFTSSSNKLQAYDEKTGQLLWESPTLAGTITSLPMTYSVGGHQYVTAFINSTGSNAIGSSHGFAGDLYAFRLP